MSIKARIRARTDAVAARARFLTTPSSSPDFGKPFGAWKAARDARGRPAPQRGQARTRPVRQQRVLAKARTIRAEAATARRAAPYQGVPASREQVREARFRAQASPAAARVQDRDARWRTASAELARRYPYQGSSRDARERRGRT